MRAGGVRTAAAGVTLALLLGLPPHPAAATPFATREVLPNGLVLLTAERRALPIVTVRVLVRAGSLHEPADLPGLANLAAVLLPQGTARRTALELSEAIDFVGGTLKAEGGQDTATVTLTLLKRDLATGLDILADLVRSPAFREEEIQRKVQQLKGAIAQKAEDAGTVAAEAFAAALYGSHPYGRPVEGTAEGLPAITRQHLVDFHARLYVPNNTLVAVAGDVTAAEVRGLFEKFLGGWPARPVPAPSLPPVASPPTRVVRRLDRELTQANIVVGHVGYPRRSPDHYALSVLNYILGGGGFTSRLVHSIREERGWAYDVHSRFSPGLEAGPFAVTLQTKNETAGDAVREVLAQLRRIRQDGITAEELRDAQAFLTGSFPLRYDTNAEVAALLTQMELHGLGMDFPERYPDLIRSLTREEIGRAAQQYLDPDRCVVIVVGKQHKISLSF
ncbi:MAG: insulinase family protein [candidate division NC10 bacterium]|nr:insulinase family protein [candidate division NC10 bacterium]